MGGRAPLEISQIMQSNKEAKSYDGRDSSVKTGFGLVEPVHERAHKVERVCEGSSDNHLLWCCPRHSVYPDAH